MQKEQLFYRHPGMIGEESFGQYAVLIPLIKISGATYLLFEKRSGKLRKQPGEICFPGGKLEPGESIQECAVRETMEELKVSRKQIEILGPGDIYIAPFHLMVHSFIGNIQNYKDTYSTDEVEEMIKIPLEFFQNNRPQEYGVQLIHQPEENFPYDWIPGGTNYQWAKSRDDILFYRYGDDTIWGMTARIVKSAVDLMQAYHIE